MFRLIIFYILSFSFLAGLQAQEIESPHNFVFKDINNKSYNSLEFFSKPTLVFFQGKGCPISDKNLSKIDKLAEKHSPHYQVLRIELNTTKINDQATLNYGQILVQDRFKVLAKYLKVRTMTEAFVIDNNRIIYRGAIDNQFNLFNSKTENITNYIDEVASHYKSDKTVKHQNTEAIGCFVDYGKKNSEFTLREFNKNIKPIIENKCLHCHQSVLDFRSYETLSQFREMIGFVIQENIMPPWPPVGDNFKYDLRLTQTEKKHIQKWVDSDDHKLLKEKINLKTQEDHEKEIDKNSTFEKINVFAGSTKIQPDIANEYRYFKVTLNNPKPMWIDFVKIQSKISFYIHHATIVVSSKEFADAQEGHRSHEPKMLVGSTSIRNFYEFGQKNYNEGFYIPKNAWFYIEVHYKIPGIELADEISLDVYKFKKTPRYGKFTYAMVVPPQEIQIPAQAPSVHIEREHEFLLDEDTQIIAVNGHMHVRGDKILFQLIKKDKKNTQPILRIDEFSYKFQRGYFLKKPLTLSKGDKIRFEFWFNNTTTNRNNPDPNVAVTGGWSVKEEMAVGTIWLRGRAHFVEQLMNNYIYK